MKKVIVTLVMAVFATAFVSAQKPQVPEFKNTVMVLKADGSLEKTEKQTATLKNKGGNRGGGWGYSFGASGDMEYITLQGGKSPVRLTSGTTFIVKLTDAETDPESAFYLTEVVVAKNTREIYTKKDSGRSVKEKYVKLTYEKVEPGVYKIKTDPLKPETEYGFVPIGKAANGESIVFLFGTN